MKNLLPKTSKNPGGFTLIELLVVMAILAVLAIIGFAILTGTQSRARDAKRREDINAMASAMEANYVNGTGYQTIVQGTWFADGVAPTNPGPGGAAYTTLGPNGSGAISTAGFSFCASLENSTGNATSSTGDGIGASSGSFFCRKNNQ